MHIPSSNWLVEFGCESTGIRPRSGRAAAGGDVRPGAGFPYAVGSLARGGLHPWPWMRRPAGGSAGSFTAWVAKHGGTPAVRG
jgi:hypothetical protein